MSNSPDFKPFPFLSGRHGQTILASCINFYREPKSKTEYILLPDQDLLTMEISTPKSWSEEMPTIIMAHGLCGSHRSAYLIRLSKKLFKKGIRTCRLNMRGCGSSRGLARHMYPSDTSRDFYLACKQIKKRKPKSPLYLIGFSMGGNAVLKLAGELGRDNEHLIDHVIGISPPVQLATSSRMLGYPANRIYERYFMKLLVEDATYRQKLFPELPQIRLHADMKLFDFDEHFTAPHIGHLSAVEYYEKSSAFSLLDQIKIPCEILYSLDDPIIDPNACDVLHLPPNVRIFKTQNGGHMGFLGSPGHFGGFRWMDSVLFQWLKV
ncbi:MAG: alpha/beta fold hydrolase [Simkaniaceae bacterium]